jgi:hemolysin III
MDFHHPFAAITHLFFAGWMAFAGLILFQLTRGHGAARRTSVALYGLSAVLLYVASGVFHGKRYESSAEAEVFRRLDLSAIFLLVAGSYLPLITYLLADLWRRGCAAVVTLLAAVGVAAVWVMPEPKSSTMLPIYVGLATVGLVPLRQYLRAAGWPAVRRMLAAAGVYLGGAICEVLRWPTVVPGWFGPHEVLHLTDVGGTLIHFGLVVRLVRADPHDPRS